MVTGRQKPLRKRQANRKLIVNAKRKSMKKITELKINIESILQAKKPFDVIGHEVRAGIIKFIHEKEEVYMSDLS